MDQQPAASKKIMAIVGLLVIVAVIGIGVAVARNSSKSTANQTAAPTAGSQVAGDSTTAASSPAAANTSGYKDGTYTATGSYDTPGGPESIGVSLTVKDGAVADATVTSNARDADSTHYQGLFIANYQSQVVGKSLDSISLSRVSGSSLTPKGFNDALTQIKSEAHS